MAKPTRRQHIVPRWYLARFTDSANALRRLHVDTQFRELVTPAGAGWAPHFYSIRAPDGSRDDQVEKFLGVIESDAKLAVDALVEGGFPLAPEHRAAIAAFVGAQLVRGKFFRSWLRETVRDAVSELREKAGDDGRAMPWPAAEEAAFDEVVVGDPADASAPYVTDYASVGIMLDSYNRTVPGLLARTWQVHMFPEPWLFTSDQPATLWDERLHRGGMTNPEGAHEIRLPLDPSCALLMGPVGAGPERVVLSDSFQAALQGNVKVLSWSQDWLYDHPDGPLRDGIKAWHLCNAGPIGQLRGRRPMRRLYKTARNEPCPCGSGLKYKRCHGR